jgi:hypothetical protein
MRIPDITKYILYLFVFTCKACSTLVPLTSDCMSMILCGRLRSPEVPAATEKTTVTPPRSPCRRRRKRTAAVGCLFLAAPFFVPSSFFRRRRVLSLVFNGSCLFRDPVVDATARVRLREIRPSAPLLNSGPEDLRLLAPSAARTWPSM